MKKDVVAGLGEIGLPIYKIISRNFPVHGYDTDKKLIPNNPKKFGNYPVRFLHVCIPYNKFFLPNILKLNNKFLPESHKRINFPGGPVFAPETLLDDKGKFFIAVPNHDAAERIFFREKWIHKHSLN